MKNNWTLLFLLLALTASCDNSTKNFADAASTQDHDARVAADSDCDVSLGGATPFNPDLNPVEGLPDVTGDGEPDTMTVVESDAGGYYVEFGSQNAPNQAQIQTEGFYVSVVAADINADGVLDVGLGSVWEGRVHFFHGPINTNRSWDDYDLAIDGDFDLGGLTPWFGITVVVADVNLDGVKDVVIAAPGEGEEACSGGIPPRAYYGPFTPQEHRGESDVDLYLAGPAEGGCLGEQAECTATGLRLSALPEAICYTFPLTSDQEPSCDAAQAR